MAQSETLSEFALQLHELERKYNLRLTAVFDGARELELVDQDDMEFYYANKVE